MREVRLVAISRPMRCHRQIASRDDVTNGHSHSAPAQVAPIRDADLAFENVLKARRRKTGTPRRYRDGRMTPRPSLVHTRLIGGEQIDCMGNPLIDLSPSAAIHEAHEIFDGSGDPSRTFGIFIKSANKRDFTSSPDDRARNFPRLADQARKTVNGCRVRFDINNGQRPPTGIELVGGACANDGGSAPHPLRGPDPEREIIVETGEQHGRAVAVRRVSSKAACKQHSAIRNMPQWLQDIGPKGSRFIQAKFSVHVVPWKPLA